MCGIAGFCNRPKQWEQDIERMKARMVRRGPDGEGSWISEEKDVVLGHRRLSIMDLSECGAQPMLSHSGRYVISYNGEIYNHKEVEEKLRADGQLSFLRGGCDTEVLLEALEAYGVREGIRLCKGMFAIALYDRKERELWLLRDRAGEKPLYYGFVGESFVFASEIASIAALPDFQNPVNRDVLDLYMIYGYIPAPYSVYEGIFKLEPGKLLRTKAPYREFTEETWWSAAETARNGQEHPFRGSLQEASEELERLLKNAVKDQMVADVPLGAFLSAGIDSSTVVSLMQSVSPGKVKTFTVGMDQRDYDEAQAARQIAARLGTEHTELYISERDAMETVPKLADMFGEPFADSSQIPTFLVSRMTREHVTVSLSGDGGDELFGGYGTYRSLTRAWDRMRGIPYPVRRRAGAVLAGKPFSKKNSNVIRGTLLTARTVEELCRLSQLSEPFLGRLALQRGRARCVFDEYESGFLQDPLHNLMLMDMLIYLPDDILVKVDRCAMAVSLESRVPMLDRDVMAFAWTLPPSMKLSDGVGKRVLREVLYRYVPKELMNRPKKGFSIPIARWLKEPGLRDWAEELLREERIRREGFFDPEAVRRLWEDFGQRGIWRKQIWHLLQFEAWLAGRKEGNGR